MGASAGDFAYLFDLFTSSMISCSTQSDYFILSSDVSPLYFKRSNENSSALQDIVTRILIAYKEQAFWNIVAVSKVILDQ